MKKTLLRLTAKVLLVTLSYQLVFPACAFALTTGPSQPEMQSFEPVGTTQMVDMFTGDFNYNIPLMDVEGYPVNIAYHSGINVEQEASWVGLGWNINPGEINRGVRGLPDDFNGETVKKELHIKDEKNFRVDLGLDVSFEKLGYDSKKYGKVSLSAGAGGYICFNNYRGVSMGYTIRGGFTTPVSSAGINIGIGSQSGADVDVSGSLNSPHESSDKVSRDAGMGIGVSGGTGFNSRTGLKDISLGVNVSATMSQGSGKEKEKASRNFSTGSTVAIGMQNYVPVITNKSTLTSTSFQVRVGGELFYTYPNGYLKVNMSTMHYDNNGDRKGYGYMYAENADENSIMDFSRDKDGYYNKTLPNLPLASMTYDVYSVSGQGTGGTFRPFRNDIGTVFDPKIVSSTSSDAYGIEAGIGNLFEAGGDMEFYDNEAESGPWERLFFKKAGDKGSLNEKLFLKQAGELTYNAQQNNNALFNTKAQYLDQDMSSLRGKGHISSGALPSATITNTPVYNTGNDRTTRANLLTYLTAEEAAIVGVGQSTKNSCFPTYSTNTINSGDAEAKFSDPVLSTRDRYDPGGAVNKPKAHHISEVTQTTPDGKRYVYGIAAMNNISQEVSFTLDQSDVNVNTYSSGIATYGNGGTTENGNDHYHSATTTPAYAHSYLLTSVLSSDYVDVLGDGPSDDDLGSYTKFHYTRWNEDYRWRAPWGSTEAQFNPGYWSDPGDDKGNYTVGSRELWHLSAIETRNHIAEFRVSDRLDGIASSSAIPGTAYTGSPSSTKSYKLDEIRLYNKHDRIINGGNAVPIKTVRFAYDYQLCPGTPNSGGPGQGKLTLTKIYIRYGSSDKNLLSPYEFTYNTGALNPAYDFLGKDRWGNYKASPTLTSYEFPYVDQKPSTVDLATSWNLREIKLPSGGKIKVDYEADDYSFVQDKRAMQMMMVTGVGDSPIPEEKNKLYEEDDLVNNYLYFKRSDNEPPGLTARQNYLDGTDVLYYSFNLDIANIGAYEHVKGYAKVEDIDYANEDYVWVKLKKERAGKKSSKMLHPATIYGLNLGRYYLPHIMHPGFRNKDGGNKDILLGLIAAAEELASLFENPLVRFVEQGKARNLDLSKCWIRTHVAGLTKKGGGVRVKKLTMSDEWNTLTTPMDPNNNTTAEYGKEYTYTIKDGRYGKISSGVASYEPMVGGDENPFRMPVKHTAESGRLLPAIEFFQEEPYGESFFPPAVVGYSAVQVRSIHASVSRSAQSEEEHEFYTAKDFPSQVDYTEKKAPRPYKSKKLRSTYEETKVLQGYVLRFNDMHGKPKKSTNYLIHVDGDNRKKETVSFVKYNYNTGQDGKLSNEVTALVRQRGTSNTYKVEAAVLGQEVDFTVDSRERYTRATSKSVDVNVNTVAFAFIIIPIPSAFWPDKEEKQRFRMMVSTKVVQQYGILKSVETYDHGAKTVVENVIYDAETGSVLLTKSNNQYNDPVYNLNHPAYLAEEGMGPAYTNVGYEEDVQSVTLNADYSATMLTNNPDRFSAGDELLLTDGNNKIKVWITDKTPDVSTSTCKFTLMTRYRTEAIGANAATHMWTGHNVNDVFYPTVKVLRSGRRNNLDQHVQQTTLAANPFIGSTSPAELYLNTSNNGTPYNYLIGVGLRQFTDRAAPYGPDENSCVTGSLDISTGYSNGSIISPGAQDPHWKITALGSDMPSVSPTTVPYNAYAVTQWSTNMPTNLHAYSGAQSAWLSFRTVPCYPTYNNPPTNYRITFSRQFRLCEVDNLEFDLWMLYDWDIVDMRVTSSSGYNQPVSWAWAGTPHSGAWTNPTAPLLNVPAGTYNLEITIQNEYMHPVNNGLCNYHALMIQGHIKSLTNKASLVDEGYCPNYVCGPVSPTSNTNNAPYHETYAANTTLYTDPVTNTVKRLTGLNKYVLGHKGNYRVLAEYAHVGNREYQNHSRVDGTFGIGDFGWVYSPPASNACGARTLLTSKDISKVIWNPIYTVSKYDVYGNIVEETGATGKYSAAVYDYSKKLPTAVGSNVRQRAFCFEGFEQYSMLLPENLRNLLASTGYYASPFAYIVNQPVNTSVITRYGQRYHVTGAGITTDASHSGKYSMKFTSAGSIDLPIRNLMDEISNNALQWPSIRKSAMQNGKKYVVSMWVKPTSNNVYLTSSSALPSIMRNSATFPFRLLTGSVDGWYLVECNLDLTNNTGTNSVLNIPANMYIDDVRFVPADASMKSFVYDPLTFRLSAQLDENHFTTFYEYDREGQLIRVKRETERGILTVKENRSANSKP